MLFVVNGFAHADRNAGHSKLFAGPFIKVNKLAAFRTERSPGIAFPFRPFSAGWTFHTVKLKKEISKSKGQNVAVKILTCSAWWPIVIANKQRALS